MQRRRIAVIAAGVVLFGGVVAVLRSTGAGDPATRASTSTPPPTSLAAFAAEGVLVPTPGAPPEQPADLRVVSGPRRMQVLWSGEEAAGYEVRWGRDGRFDHTKLIAQSATQLDGLDDGAAYQVEVRAVDAFGQRSEPARGEGTPRTAKIGDYALVDAFDQPDAPDPARWRLATRNTCARATPGQGDDGARLVISSNCASAPASLRSRTPFVLRDADDLGRVVVETDAPGADGELTVDLVPGPVSTVSGDGLPPDALRLRVAGSAGKTSAEVLTPEGTPTTPTRAVPTLEQGLSHRWELVLRRDGARVLMDGDVVATSPAVPRWREATALISVSGPTGQRVNISLVAFDAAPATAPPFVPPPQVRVAIAPDAAPVTGTPIRGVTGGQLRMTLLHTDSSPTAPEFTVAVGDTRVPLRPAVPGAPWRAAVGYPVVADIPAAALVQDGDQLAVTVVAGVRMQATHVDLELTPAPDAPPAPRPSTEKTPLNGLEPVLARANGTVLDAGGRPVPEGSPIQRGRVVFELTLDGRSGQRGTGVAGLAGFTVRLDGDRVASVPTNLGGPGVAGVYRLALNTSGLSFGPHMIEVKLFSTSSDTRPTSAFVPFFVSQ
ncbi:fibronectin type III domain-containing protein [Actinosynnema sp. CS-041913]|uniref:fibronectin type III domain-containing protein n=1 Tax=Actinosynnema sp. CS-041913 TaxID=3239917 RepID=UPI003D8B0125